MQEIIENKTDLSNEELDQLAHMLKAIAHPARLAIVDLLSRNECLHCTQLMESIGVEQSLLSHHLSTMFDRGILAREKEGKFIQYRLADQRIAKIVACLVQKEV
jgi:DNA-binding transcriptional ArsR family regulator